MGKVIWVIIILILIGIVSVLIWGFTTNWWKSFDGEEASRYCYTACVNLDKGKYCTPNLIVHLSSGSIWKDINCDGLAMNDVAGRCIEISCP